MNGVFLMSEVPLYRAECILEYIIGTQALRGILNARQLRTMPASGGAGTFLYFKVLAQARDLC
jgi:hypothetical protein